MSRCLIPKGVHEIHRHGGRVGARCQKWDAVPFGLGGGSFQRAPRKLGYHLTQAASLLTRDRLGCKQDIVINRQSCSHDGCSAYQSSRIIWGVFWVHQELNLGGQQGRGLTTPPPLSNSRGTCHACAGSAASVRRWHDRVVFAHSARRLPRCWPDLRVSCVRIELDALRIRQLGAQARVQYAGLDQSGDMHVIQPGLPCAFVVACDASEYRPKIDPPGM